MPKKFVFEEAAVLTAYPRRSHIAFIVKRNSGKTYDGIFLLVKKASKNCNLIIRMQFSEHNVH
jgi:hypothetical protein